MQVNNQGGEQEKTFTEIIAPYLNRWKLVLICLLLCLGATLVYLRYSTPEYKTASKILIKDEKRGQSAADLDIFKDLGIGSGSGNIDNELEILKSRTLMQRVADSLQLHVSYYQEGRIKRLELYKESPVRVTVNDYNGMPGYWMIDLSADGKFVIEDQQGDFSYTSSPGEEFDTPFGKAQVTLSEGNHEFPVWVAFKRWEAGEKITITSINKLSGVVDISMISPTPKKNEDIINTLVRFYNLNNMDDKRWVTDQTIRFIDSRLIHISSDLERIERDVESYKKKYQLTDLQAEAGLYLSSGSEYDKKIAEIELQKAILSSLQLYVSSDDNKYNAIPSNLGITDVSLISLIEQYNKMQLARREVAGSMTRENPLLLETERQILSLRNDILAGISNAGGNYDTTLANLKSKEDAFMSKIQNLSTNEREFRGFVRQKEITESIFLYLLQKREESAISLSMVSPNAKVIDTAYTSPQPVRPRKSIVLIIGFILGLLIPIGIIYILELLNNKIKTREDIEKLAKSPVVGIVPEKESQSGDIVVQEDDRSGIVEMYRLLCTNLEFMLTGDNEKVLMITSSIPSEGKSSFSVNLALAWATVGKKVLLIDLDMRNSRMKELFQSDDTTGMSLYLAEHTLKPKNVIQPSGIQDNLDVAFSGIFPPNPVQLLLSKRLDEFFREARENYDIIVVDTPPVMLVTDSLLINRLTDATVYVTRSGITLKNFLRVPEELSRNNKLKKLSYVIKGVGKSNGYGYGYGYGLEREQKGLSKALKKIWKKK